MKRKVVAIMACLALVFGMFGAEVKENKADSTVGILFGTTDNGNCVLNEDSFGPYMKEVLEICKVLFPDYADICDNLCIGKTAYDHVKKAAGDGLTPGMTYNVGDTVSLTGNAVEMLYFLKDPFTLTGDGATYISMENFAMTMGSLPLTEGVDAFFYQMPGLNSEMYTEGEPYSVVVPAMEGVTAWRVQYVISLLTTSGNPYFRSIVLLFPVQESSLVTSGNTTQWIDGTGRVLWTITEETDKIVANLTDCSAIKADYVKAWNESGKALSITYKYNGYTVAIDVPAGELTDTGAEWYGPEYLAAVNQKYVVVKDVYGIVVPNDRIYKK